MASYVFCRSTPAGLGEHQRLTHGEAVADHQHLVDELHRLAGTIATHMGDCLAHGAENGQGTLELGGIAAHHDAQGALGRTFTAAAHRRIQHKNAPLQELRRNFLRGLRADRAAVDDQGTGLGAMDDTVFAQDHCLHVRRIADTDDDNIAALSHVSGIGAGMGTLRHEFFHARNRAVPYGDGKACLQQVGCHATPHNAEADKPYTLHDATSPKQLVTVE